ncbi:F0F1 ATP synthase subunit delta [Lapillicoccus jejuensis]|uniref:ATP synthase subunit delta n=1 Tax=Lapillicoccus jejuensis TaxID=402171 RepID=A0A542E2R0_9MICO|nr:F0F1 ATP synthase subunit delta [Lapillicoccus jejuensis]TQJ09622.1 ATP synthase F1 subcomplex delta subunit [Lapillicoccus jejuensis]
MQGSSRAALVAAQEALTSALDGGADAAALADDLFAVVGAVDGSAALRRALGDPSREGDAKAELARRLFGGKVGDAALGVVTTLVSQRWAAEHDLTDAGEQLAVGSVVASAERAGRADQVEDELFRFERIVAGNPGLRDALTDRRAPTASKAEVVEGLLRDKVAPETLRLARQAVTGARGRRFDRVMETYQSLAETRRGQLAAQVVAAVPLDESQRHRLVQSLSSHYGKPVHLNVVVDPQVVGGIRVQVGDEVVDGTILRRLDQVRRSLGA